MAAPTCQACRDGHAFSLPISMAFQPIVDLQTHTVFAHEALVRGADGAGAAQVLSQVDESNRYAFDQACRVKAIEWASQLGVQPAVSINFMPNAVYQPEVCLRTTLAVMDRLGMSSQQVIFEVTEHESITDQRHLRTILSAYRRRGFRTAIDDFGAGHSGLNLLADFQPDLIKLDMALIRHIDTDTPRQVIVDAVISMCRTLGVEVIAEGVETTEELRVLHDLGIRYFQGYLFARPAFQALASVSWPALGELMRDNGRDLAPTAA